MWYNADKFSLKNKTLIIEDLNVERTYKTPVNWSNVGRGANTVDTWDKTGKTHGTGLNVLSKFLIFQQLTYFILMQSFCACWTLYYFLTSSSHRASKVFNEVLTKFAI